MKQRRERAAPAYTMRKSAGLRNRKGMPQKFSPNQVIVDEEFLLSQTPQKQMSSHLNSSRSND